MRKLNIILFIFIGVTISYVFLIYIAVINPESSQYTHNDSVFEKKGDKKIIIIAFRNDDLSVNSNLTHEESVLNIFWKYGIKQTFAFIPKRGVNKNFELNYLNEKAPILEALKNWSKQGKIEFAVHGYVHKKSEGSSGEFDGLPYDSQLGKITDGKRIIDKIFNINVNMFAPPWNQADNNTVKACLNSGIHIFSGYLGEIPADGMTFVNTNAVLFPKANPMGESTGLPSFEDVLAHAKKCQGTIFIIIFYHSNSDFKSPEDYSYLLKLLKNISNDPSIEVSSIGEIADKYRDYLPAYNQAGLNIKEADNAKHRAKPYVILYRKVNDIIGGELSIDRLYDDAFIAYWSGNYEQASNLASKIIARCDNYIVYGRIMAIVGSGAAFLMFLGAINRRKTKPSFGHYRDFLLIFVVPLMIVGGYLNIVPPVSAIRIEEFNIIAGLYVGGILIQIALTIAIKREK
jgi:hypothetical protein